MSEPKVIPAGGGEVVGDAPDRRVEILADQHALHATWSRFGPGRDGADLHVHYRHTDFFYVLDGELTMRLGREGEEVRVPAGSLVCVPPRVIHGFRNGSDADVRYLNLHAPGAGFADYMRARRDGRPLTYDQFDPPADGERTAADVVIAPPPADRDVLAVAERRDPPPASEGVQWLYVLEGALSGTWVELPGGAAPPAELEPGTRMLHLRPA